MIPKDSPTPTPVVVDADELLRLVAEDRAESAPPPSCPTPEDER